MNVLVWLCVVVFIFLISHLTVDKDFDPNIKIGAWIGLVAVGILYVVFGIIM